MFQLKKIKLEGEKHPRGYGIAYRNWEDNTMVCYPLGLNWIINWSRAIWFIIRYRLVFHRTESVNYWFNIGYRKGYTDGGRAMLVTMIVRSKNAKISNS